MILVNWPQPMEELEGIAICDLDHGQAPHIHGQIHVVLLDNDGNDDDIIFMHYWVSPEDRDKI